MVYSASRLHSTRSCLSNFFRILTHARWFRLANPERARLAQRQTSSAALAPNALQPIAFPMRPESARGAKPPERACAPSHRAG
jgi:hypothetical protein